MFTKFFTTYSPEARGLQSGSNNGNYTEWTEFKYDDGKFYVKHSTSGDGDVYPWPQWEEVTPEKFFTEFEQAVIEEYRELQLPKDIAAERIREGLARAMKHGTKSGRPVGRPEPELPEEFPGFYHKIQTGLLTKVEVANMLQVGRSTLYRWIRRYEKSRS